KAERYGNQIEGGVGEREMEGVAFEHWRKFSPAANLAPGGHQHGMAEVGTEDRAAAHVLERQNQIARAAANIQHPRRGIGEDVANASNGVSPPVTVDVEREKV